VGKSYIGVVDYQFADNPSANYTEIFMGPAGALRSPVTAPKVMGGLLLALAILVVGVFALLVRRRRAVPTRQPLPGL
jgi:hypothetical protein